MSEASESRDVTPRDNEETRPAPADPTDRPIPIWPEGVIVVLAGVALLAIGLKHRTYLRRKFDQCKGAYDEFSRHGGVDEIRAVAKQAVDFVNKSRD